MATENDKIHYRNKVMLGQHLDLSNAPRLNQKNDLAAELVPPNGALSANQNQDREFLGINFECCKVYSRIFINDEKNKFAGNCPRCGKYIKFDIAPDGTDSRFFEVY